jgi:hypothetical protein
MPIKEHMVHYRLLFFILMGLVTQVRADEVTEFLGNAPQKIDYHSGDWEIKKEEMDRDKISYKNQNDSIIEWDKIDPVEWLDVTNWMASRKIRDDNPDWKIKYRDSLNKELVGKVIACSGECRLFRGIKSSKAQFLSEIREGDEITTGANSTLWLMLINGTLIRFSAESSMAFNEINIAQNEYFFLLRLNYGHVHSEQRFIGTFEFEDKAETDPAVLPLALKEANREFFARADYSIKDKTDFTFLTTNYPGAISQKENLNKLVAEDAEEFIKKDQKIFLISPNGSILLKNSHFDYFYEMHGKSYFRLMSERPEFVKNDSRVSTAEVYFRGYSNNKVEEISSGFWYEMSQDGRILAQNSEVESQFKPVDFLTTRVPSILMAREYLLRKFGKFAFEKLSDQESFAKNFGYKIWDKTEDIDARLAFLKEYTRRIETTQLGSMEKIKKQEPTLTFGAQYYLSSFHLYLKEIKNSNQKEKRQIAEMNDIEYYVYILKNNK